MRMRRYWTDAEVEKLRSMAGNCSLDQIAQKLGRPRGSVATKAHDLKVSLSYHRRRPEPGSMDPAPAGWTLRADVRTIGLPHAVPMRHSGRPQQFAF
jgi:hypothetical protein